ncbi:hypothetical protein [Nocardia neocaledoniensis]|uniref:hypothetical protein n=1 Tax=Nocardia neocaledoniensis TaxID=236511 RepID=UPI002453F6E1|nr:hypothetical protein [Nocardia neocaledoniensis]
MNRRRTEAELRIAVESGSANPVDQRGVPHYTLVDVLPSVCVEHGRPAVETYEAAIQFDDTYRFTLSDRLGSYLSPAPDGVGIARQSSEADSVVHARWPICPRCRLRIHARGYLFLFLVFAAMCTVIGAFGAAQTGQRDIAVVLAFVIGLGAPVILLAITAAFTGLSTSPARHVRRSQDRKFLIVRAHRRFAEEASRQKTTD